MCAKFLNGECSSSFFNPNYSKENIDNSNNFSLFKFPNNPNLTGKAHAVQELKFDSDWNWIMEIVDKIESLENYYIEMSESDCYVFDVSKFDDSQVNPIIWSDNKSTSKKEAVTKAIYKFLIYYNENNN